MQSPATTWDSRGQSGAEKGGGGKGWGEMSKSMTGQDETSSESQRDDMTGEGSKSAHRAWSLDVHCGSPDRNWLKRLI